MEKKSNRFLLAKNNYNLDKFMRPKNSFEIYKKSELKVNQNDIKIN